MNLKNKDTLILIRRMGEGNQKMVALQQGPKENVEFK